MRGRGQVEVGLCWRVGWAYVRWCMSEKWAYAGGLC